MTRLPNMGLGLAGLAVFVLALLALVQGEDITLTEPGGAPPDTSGGADGGTADGTGAADGGQDAQKDPESIVRVHPDKVVIQGEKLGLRDVNYSTVTLTAWISDLSADKGKTDEETTNEQTTNERTTNERPTDAEKTPQDGDSQAPTPPKLSWSPVSAGNGSLPLTVDEPNTGPCAGNRAIPRDSLPPTCYTLTLGGSSRLPAGTYGATIYVGDAPDGRRAIPVEVLVGRPLLWLIGVVAAGVLATELVVWWREGAVYRRGWQVRRAKWLDWLSENLGWTRPYERGTERNDIERTVLRVVKESLREKVAGVRTWLDRGTKGGTTIALVPANRDAARDMVYPLRLERERYVAFPVDRWEARFSDMEQHLAELGQEAVAQSRTDLEEAHDALPQVHWDPQNGDLATAYGALDDWWNSDPSTTADRKLSEAWVAIRALWKRAEELKNEAPTRPRLPDDATVPADTAGATEALSGYLSKLRADVFSKASATLDTLEGIPPDASGRQETVDFLDMVITRVPALEQTEQAVDRANHPLKFAEPESAVGQQLENLKRDLQAVDERIDSIASRNLTEDAIRTIMLKPVREQLESTETRFYDSSQDMKQRWLQVRSNFNQSRHFVRLGKGIFKQKERFEGYKQQFEAQFEAQFRDTNGRPAKSAYRFLLKTHRSEAYRSRERYYRFLLETDRSEVDRSLKGFYRFLLGADRSLKSAYRFLLDGNALDAEVELERAEYSLDKAYEVYIARANMASWWNRVLAGTKKLPNRVGELGNALKRFLFSPAFPILIVTVAALMFILRLLKGYVKEPVHNMVENSEAKPDTALERLSTIGLETADIIIKHPLPFGFLFGLLLAILIFAALFIRERWENVRPFTVRLLLGTISGLLSLAIAVTVILAYQQTVPEDQMITWGTNLDLVIAFALGVLAHRIVQSLRSASEDLMSFLKGEKKPDAAEGEASEKKETGTTESGATVATKGG